MAVPQMNVSMLAPHSSSLAPLAPDPEVAATADRSHETGEIGALLRREGIHSSQLAM